MIKFYQTLTNKRGDALTGYRVQVVDSEGAVVPIYADSSGTPFTGSVNYATADSEGLVEFYWTPAAGQVLQTLDPAGDLIKSVADFAAVGGGAVVFLQSGTGATTRTMEDKGRDRSSVKDFGAVGDGTANDTAAIEAAIADATASVLTTQGRDVDVPRGTYKTSTPINIANRAGLIGDNKRGTIIKADPAFSGSYMFTVDNGTSSMFDNPLERLTLNCDDVAGLGAIDSEAWQEGGGLSKVLLQKFRTYGVRFRNMDGGAAVCQILDSEIFGSALGCTAGILLQDAGLSSPFQLTVENTTLAGGGATASSMPRAIDVIKGSLNIRNSHVENCTTGIYLDGNGNHTLIGFTGSAGAVGVSEAVGSLVEIAATFTGSLTMIGCQRNGATNFLKDNRAGGLGTITGRDEVFLVTNLLYHPGAIIANGNLNGAAMTVTSANGVSSFARTGGAPAGDYTVTLSTTLQTLNDLVVTANSNLAGGYTTKDVLGVNSFRIRTYNASAALADSNEISFHASRVK